MRYIFTKKDRKIINQKAMIENRDKLIDNQAMKIEELEQENIAVHNENKDLRFEIEEKDELIKQFEEIAKTQQFGSVINIQNKIKSILETAKSI